MQNYNEINITLMGKMGEMLDEISLTTGEEPAKIVEMLIFNYHRKVTSKPERLNKENDYSNLKVGKIANIHLRKLLESGKISSQLLALLQTVEYSKINFDLQYPLLVKQGTIFESVRYYKSPLLINDEKYYMCSQWFETTTNDDRSFLLDWMDKFKTKGDTRL
jgi:hypothetical protein